MRERSQTAPRRRGPKHPLPPRDSYEVRRDFYEPPSELYYSIDNTEEIYGTNLSSSQRCYVDPWDLENYDYVRKKLESTPSPSGYYENSLSPSPAGETVSSKYYYMPHPQREEVELAPRMSSTIPRNRRRRAASHFECDLEECCAPRSPIERRFEVESPNARMYGRGRFSGGGKYSNYMMHMTEQLQLEDEDAEEDLDQNIYTGYGGFSSSSSIERNSSLGDESGSALLLHTPGFGSATSRRRSVALPKPPPKIEFPAPPPLSPTYESFGNPYATLPYCSVSDCYECLYAEASSAIYGGGNTSSIYGGSCNTLGRRPPSSLYGGVYANKFGLSKKGLLQIDYSCSWNDLDRVLIGRNF